MPRYFFNVRNGDYFKRDSHGTTVPDLGTIRKIALKRARDVLAKDPDTMVEAEFEITDQGGIIVEAVPFSEALLD
jgi:hypothetical protein